MARAAGLLREDGVVAASVFTEMSALAQRTGALNLGQGFPDDDGPEFLRAGRRGHPGRTYRSGRPQPVPALPELAGVVAIPAMAFCQPGSETWATLRSHVRFTFVKREATVREAVRRLASGRA